ncbi:MAG: hypothetical protein PHC35_02195 [Deltaproteobacteria bacterium]|jgi:hypothetical protein|nr:hypothetical protein [Deltaproteobacteria bacterium]
MQKLQTVHFLHDAKTDIQGLMAGQSCMNRLKLSKERTEYLHLNAKANQDAKKHGHQKHGTTIALYIINQDKLHNSP